MVTIKKRANTIKIGITGSNNTGKTSLAYALYLALKLGEYEAEIAHESVRECPIGAKQDTTPDSQLWILARQMQIETTHAHHDDFVISDKTPIDTLCYGIWGFRRMRNPPSDTEEKLRILRAFTEAYLPTYDYMFLLPVVPSIELKVWHPGVDHRAEIDKLIREIVMGLKVPVIEVSHDALINRLGFVLDRLAQDRIIELNDNYRSSTLDLIKRIQEAGPLDPGARRS